MNEHSTALTSSQRKHLRGVAHDLRPAVQLGKHGLSQAFVRQVDRALDQHELIKVRLAGAKAEKLEMLDSMAQELHCQTVGLVGHVATIYRQQRDPDKPRMKLEPA